MILKPKWCVLSIAATSRNDSNVAQRLTATCSDNEKAARLLTTWLDCVTMPPNPDIQVSIQEIRG